MARTAKAQWDNHEHVEPLQMPARDIAPPTPLLTDLEYLDELRKLEKLHSDAARDAAAWLCVWQERKQMYERALELLPADINNWTAVRAHHAVEAETIRAAREREERRIEQKQAK